MIGGPRTKARSVLELPEQGVGSGTAGSRESGCVPDLLAPACHPEPFGCAQSRLREGAAVRERREGHCRSFAALRMTTPREQSPTPHSPLPTPCSLLPAPRTP